MLGIPRDATQEQIRRAYQLRSKLLHPDRHAGAAPDLVAEANRAMAELNGAWEQLRRSPKADVQTDRSPTPPPSHDPRPNGQTSGGGNSDDGPEIESNADDLEDWFLGAVGAAGPFDIATVNLLLANQDDVLRKKPAAALSAVEEAKARWDSALFQDGAGPESPPPRWIKRVDRLLEMRDDSLLAFALLDFFYP